MTRLLYNPVTVTFTAESLGEEGFAFGVDVKGINHGAQDMAVVTLVVFKGFVRSDLLVVVLVEEVVIKCAPVVKVSLHNSSAQVLIGSCDGEFFCLLVVGGPE